MKEVCGLNPRKSYNRYDSGQRTNPCPENKQQDLIEAFKHFGMINTSSVGSISSQGCATTLILILLMLGIFGVPFLLI